MSLSAGARLGPYELETLAGEGASGVVYRARDRERDRIVALKVLREEGAADPDRFEGEAEVLQALAHPGIARYLDHGVSADGRPYLATEWLEGETLASRLQRGPLSPEQAAAVASRIAEALGAAHARGAVHRDLKPANVFLVAGSLDDVRLLDFGLALWVHAPTSTEDGAVAGTPAYMAPEQARGASDVDARADVFSLGCILHESLTGRPPFVGPHPVAVLARVVFDDVPPVHELVPAVPRRLSRLVSRMLAKDPGGRPEDGAAVARALAHPEARSSVLPAPTALSRERRLVSVLVAKDEPGRDLGEIRRSGEREGLDLARLAGGALVGTLRPREVATDLASAAARVARSLSEALGGARVALATGRAELSRGAPVGEAIDVASALWRQGSEPGVVVDETTRGLLAGAWELDGQRLLGRRATDAGRELLGRATPLVGRDRELAVLEELVLEAEEEEHPVGALVTAPPGGGKSRLRRELMRRLSEREPPVRIDYARGDAVRAASPLGLARELLRSALGLARSPSAARGRARLSERVDERAAEFLAEVLGWSAEEPSDRVLAARRDPGLMLEQQRSAWIEWLRAASRAGPVALVLEDLQWADAASLRLLDAGLTALPDAPIAVIAFGRPELRERIGETLSAAAPLELRLAPLSARASAALVRAVLDDVDEATVEALVERAEGNAFHLEELIRSVAEGSDAEAFPTSVVAMAQARLEALEPRDRQVLRAASVLGRAFWPGAVAALTGLSDDGALRERLDALAQRELVRRHAQSRFVGEPELVFRHDLVQQASYATLGEDDRARAHAAAARWLTERGVDDPVTLATHLERAADREGAARLWLRAAQQGMSAHDFDAALDAARRAADSPHTRGAARALQATVHRWRGEHAAAIEAAEDALELLAEGAADWLGALGESLLAHGRSGAYDRVVEAFERGLALPPDPSVERVLFFVAAGRQLFHAGRYDLAERAIAEAMRGGDPDRLGPAVAAQVHGLRAAAARHRGDLLGDLEGYSRTLAAFERVGDDRNACNTRVSVGFARAELGDFEAARGELERALADAERLRLASIETRARQNLGLVLGSLGRHDEAASLLDRVIAESLEQGNVRFAGWSGIYRAQVAFAAGDPDEALAHGQRASERLAVSPPAQAGADAICARALVRLGRPTEAAPLVQRAMGVLHDLGGIEEFESLVQLAAAELGAARGDDGPLRRARERLGERAGALDVERRESFLTRVPENAATLSLARERGIE